MITTIAGTGASGYEGDGGPATAALLDEPSDVAVDAERRRSTSSTAPTTRCAGSAPTGSSPRSPATAARASRATAASPPAPACASPRDVAVRGRRQRVRRRRAATTASAGSTRTGRSRPSRATAATPTRGDGGLATDAELDTPSAILPLRDGGVLIADAGHAVLRKLASDGTIATVAGNGTPGFRGDGGPAAKARIDFPQAIALGADDTVYVADAGNDRIRALAPSLPGLSARRVHDRRPTTARSLYVFDRSGRHLRTLDALTGAEHAALRLRRARPPDRHRATATASRRRSSATRRRADGDRRPVRPDDDAAGLGGRLPEPDREPGRATGSLLEYDAGGLLTKLTDPRDGVHTFELRHARPPDPRRARRRLRADADAARSPAAPRRSSRTARRGPHDDLPRPAHGRRLDPALGDRRRRRSDRDRHRQRRRHDRHPRRRHAA